MNTFPVLRPFNGLPLVRLSSGRRGLAFNKVDELPKVPTNAAEMAEFVAEGGLETLGKHTAEEQAKWMADYTGAINKGGQLKAELLDEMATKFEAVLKEAGVTDLPTKAEIKNMIPHVAGNGANARNKHYNPNAPGAAVDKLGFQNIGVMASLVVRNARDNFSPTDDETKQLVALRAIQNAYSSTDPASAGFLIPEETRAEIMDLAMEMAVVRPRATVINMTSKTLSIPFVDVTTHSGSLFGGMTWTWTAEAAALIASEAKFGKVELEASKLTGLARVPNELLADAAALSTWLNASMPMGLAYYEDVAFIGGNGAGQPLGVLESPALISVTRASANEVNFADIANMFARMLPQSMASAVWVVNQTVLPQLLQLTIDVGTGGSHVPLVQALPDSPLGIGMLGRPIVITEKAAALGSATDISFVDFKFYLIGDRQAVSIDSSGHSRFGNDETEIRVLDRVDGRPWVQSALTPLNGDTVSPYVSLAA
jgi:HK97 family phage major capsid protein